MNEEWKDIEGYENLYQVSNFGRVKSLPKEKQFGNSFYITKEKILENQRDKDGYLEVNLYKNKKGKHYKIHRLVAKAFILNLENKPEVNHIDGNKENNCVINLEWVSPKENINHAYDTELIKRRTRIICINDGRIFKSITQASSFYGVSKSMISEVCNKKRNDVKGLIFKKY